MNKNVVGKEKSIQEILKACKYIKIKQNVAKLKYKHQYYAQVQLGMAVLNLDYCDFVIFASQNKSLKIINEPFDYTFTCNMLQKIKEKFFNNMLHVICETL